MDIEDKMYDYKYGFAKIIRVITISPINALVLVLILKANTSNVFTLSKEAVSAIIFLCVGPVSAYFLQRFIPAYKDNGRRGQRDLAIIASNISYAIGIVSGYLLGFSPSSMFVMWTYLFCGAGIMVFNRFCVTQISGHACGAAGPAYCLMYFFGIRGALSLIVLAAVWASSLIMKRHKPVELVLGSLEPLLAMALAYPITLL